MPGTFGSGAVSVFFAMLGNFVELGRSGYVSPGSIIDSGTSKFEAADDPATRLGSLWLSCVELTAGSMVDCDGVP